MFRDNGFIWYYLLRDSGLKKRTKAKLIDFLLPGLGRLYIGRWGVGRALVFYVFTVIVGLFTMGLGYLLIGLIMAATL